MIVVKCKECGGTNVYDVEFRTDYACPRMFDPANDDLPELEPKDAPSYMRGYYCMACDHFCSVETEEVKRS